MDEFIDASQDRASGWLGFYWGKPPERLRESKELGDALLLQWLVHFQQRAKGPGAAKRRPEGRCD